MSQSQVVVLSIGDKQCGDAMLLRYGDINSGDREKQHVVLIDGGYKDDWHKVQDVLLKNFNTNWIDLVVSTHPDKDHISGLIGVLENIKVGKLWMHQPWQHSDEILASLQNDFTEAGLTKALQKALQLTSDLQAVADQQNVDVTEPFSGSLMSDEYGALIVLGPSKAYYEELLPQMIDKSVTKASAPVGTTLQRITQSVRAAARKIVDVIESHFTETLKNTGETTPSNDSSVIMLFKDDNKTILFTGDAGIGALSRVEPITRAAGLTPGRLSYIQVPHHSSRQNVGPDILDALLGSRTDAPDEVRGKAFASVATNCEVHGHPKRVVLNAFKRRGYPVIHQNGQHFKIGSPLDGFTEPISSAPLYTNVERDE